MHPPVARRPLDYDLVAAMDSQQPFTTPLPSTGRLERSSWKAEAIRRGQLKISGPIPWEEDDADEKLLTKRHTHPLPPRTPESPSPAHDSPPRPQQQQQQHRGEGEADEAIVAQDEDEYSSQRAARRRSPSQTQTHPQHRHARSSTALHTFAASHDDSTTAGDESPAPKKKRRSGLRTVFRKMFGRKSKSADGFGSSTKRQSASPERRQQVQQQQQEEDEEPKTAASPPPPPTTADARNARIFSVPFQELQPRGPLGAHLPFPMNVNAPENISPPHEYLTFDGQQQPLATLVHRRRASLPSVVFSSADQQALAALWAADGQPVTALDEQQQQHNPPDIGVAVSSPRHLKRRSRSAGALQDLARTPAAGLEVDAVAMLLPARTPRRRSAEIRYWRLSSGVATGTAAKDAHRTNASPPASAHGARDTLLALDPDQIQAFNFGNLTGQPTPEVDRTPTMTEQSTVSYDDTPLRDDDLQPAYVEHALPFATHRVHQPVILEDVPKGRRASRGSSSADGRGSERTSSTSRGLGFVLAPYKSTTPPSPVLPSLYSPYSNMSPPPSVGNLPGFQYMDPALTADKLKMVLSPDHALPAADAPLPTAKAAEQFAAIYTILRHERAARKSLEKQVIAMQREMQELRALAHKLASASYPTPSPDTLPIDPAHDAALRPRPPRANPVAATSRFSGFDSGDDDQDTPHPSNIDEAGRRTPEVFETPREESVPYSYGFVPPQSARAVTVGEGGKF